MSPWPKYRSGAIRQIGPTQLEMLRQAAHSPSGQIILDDISGKGNARWCAMKRMVRRGLFDRQEFGNAVIGTTVIYTITDNGRQALKREESR